LLYDYDARGNVARVRGFGASQNGVETSYTFDSLNRLATVYDYSTLAATYDYNPVGSLESYQTANSVKHQYRYNALNRLTNLVVIAGSVALAQFDYTLGLTGQRDKLVEHVNGVWRTNDWQYDRQYRLTNEWLHAASGTVTGQVAYAYDAVANRTNRASTLSQLISTNSSYNTNDWLTADLYDSAGNTTNAAGVVYRYNADNQLTNVVNGSTNIAIIYNADGNRIRKTVTVGGTTTETYYLIDLQTPTGYAQVLEEWVTVNSATTRKFYTYGLDLISQRLEYGPTNYFGYDGHGSVRFLTGSGTNVTDTYTYDAYGTLIAKTGTTLNHFLYAGEQFDEDLGQYYLRARYMNPETGRFLTLDSYDGSNEDPLSLHKFLYASVKWTPIFRPEV
jgi:RHS repeat-associated protein